MIDNPITRRIFVVVCTMLVSLALLPLAGMQGEATAALDEAQKTERALQFITQHGTTIAEIMTSDSMPKQKKRLKLKAILEENLDIETMIRAIVGPYWRKMDAEQRKRYQSASGRWVVLYSANFLSTVKATKFDVLSANLLGRDVLVETETRAKGSTEPFVMHWRVRFKPDDEATLIDMHFRGLSMIAAQRSEVSTVVAEKGIPAFLDKLDERLEKITQAFNKK